MSNSVCRLAAVVLTVPAVLNAGDLRLTVLDPAGAVVAGARVQASNAQNIVVREGVTDGLGVLTMESLAASAYAVEVAAPGFADAEALVRAPAAGEIEMIVALRLGAVSASTTVTAGPGSVEDVRRTSLLAVVKSEEALRERPLTTLGNALEEEPGIHVQQSASGQVSPFLRGMTGYHVLNLIDGVRFNNSIFRSGPSQYLAYIDPAAVRRLEATLGPAGAELGSDSLGGSINALTVSPRFAEAATLVRAEIGGSAASADLSWNSRANLSIGSSRAALLLGGDFRKYGDIRAGRGRDSRHTLRRFFDLPFDQIRGLLGSRQQDTAFSQYGYHAKLALRPAGDQSLTLWYQQSELDGVRNSRALWGGQGRLVGDFDPQILRFGYARYEKRELGFLDSLAGTFSVNSQRDGFVGQNENLDDPIISDGVGVDAYGFAGQGTVSFAPRSTLVFGGEAYLEDVSAFRTSTDPAGGSTQQVRALYPNGSQYDTRAVFADGAVDLLGGRLRASGGGRYTRVDVETFASRDPFGVIDSAQSFDDVTFNAALAWDALSRLRVHARIGRGFRVPNMNDLGAIGLQDLGFEIPASEAAGALIGSSAGEDALPIGRTADTLSAETLYNYELGFTARGDRWHARLQLFDAELRNPIVRRTLLFPATSPPDALAGLPVTPIEPTPGQAAARVVAVAVESDPRAVKAFVNDGRTRFYGLQSLIELRPAPSWLVAANYTYTLGRDLDPNRNLRRLPPQGGAVRIRHSPSRKLWWEAAARFAGAQTRLSGGDVSDERIGASRSRADIARVFHGARLSEYVVDGVFTPTGETLREIQDRVLPLGGTIHGVSIAGDGVRAPMFTQTGGWFTMDVRGGWSPGGDVDFYFGIENLLDRSYRRHGSGVDSPGANLFLGTSVRF